MAAHPDYNHEDACPCNPACPRFRSAIVKKKKDKLVYYVVQEGGTSQELYLHSFNQKREAERYQRSCANGAYRSSEVGRLPARVIDVLKQLGDEELFDVMFELTDAAQEVN
jgi:hypothetical protein